MALYTQRQTPSLLWELAPRLRECRPEEHKISYSFESWKRCFPQDDDLVKIQKQFGQTISRGSVLGLAREAQAETARLRQFAMAVMIWGYGTVGYGPTRTSAMLAHPQAVQRLARGTELVRSGDFAEACLFFRSNGGSLPQFSWSFFTKYFYFVGLASNLSPTPLILDGSKVTNGVAGGMKQLADAGDQEAAYAMKLWWSTVDRRCAEGYSLYVTLVNRWADDLGCRPDAIEMALWKGLNP